jgi:hypothetical protein
VAAAGCLASIAAAAVLGSAPAASAADGPGSASDITFSVSGIIALPRALPAITSQVTIDGTTTAPGYASGGPPTVEIQCGGDGGLDFAAGSAGSRLLCVAVDDAGGNGVMLHADSITVDDDYIGLNLSGRTDGNRGNGIFVGADSSSDSIGLNRSGDSGAVANVISGNTGNGLVLSGSYITRGASDNEIGGTEFTDAKTNRGDGLLIDGSAHRNTVGGNTVSVIPQNTFSGNDGYGLTITGSAYGNSVFNSFIGTNVLGTLALGNLRGGVPISGRAHGNSIGDTGKPPVNLVSGYTGAGAWLSSGASYNRVIDNYIGLSRFGKPLRNTGKPVVNDGRHNIVKGNIW